MAKLIIPCIYFDLIPANDDYFVILKLQQSDSVEEYRRKVEPCTSQYSSVIEFCIALPDTFDPIQYADFYFNYTINSDGSQITEVIFQADKPGKLLVTLQLKDFEIIE